MATELIPPNLELDNNPEHYELLSGRLVRKTSAGRKKHSQIGRIIRAMLESAQQKLGGILETEWTMLNGADKVIPDVTLSYPEPRLHDDYFVAPAFLVVETASRDQSLSSLLKKCRDRYHFGTSYCWIIDSEEEVGYECHKADSGLIRFVDVLTAGPEIGVSVADISTS